jgi:hypothetical protein
MFIAVLCITLLSLMTFYRQLAFITVNQSAKKYFSVL